jgi:MoaA/NifB/PqqE/SkfB family radical SAM enzyme
MLNNFIHNFGSSNEIELIKERFKTLYGSRPPGFIVLAPSQQCNLRCTGCYASSSVIAPKLNFSVVDKIVDEVYNEWGQRFMTITGGEPFLYKDNKKTLFDIWKKYNDMLFLVYTNGTLLSKDTVKKLSKVGNVTPAISMEGFEKETDERRGKGIFTKIIEATNNLKEAGVPFGVSLTATRKNFEILNNEKFYDFIFQELGATYVWMFQLMPIGQAKDMKELMLTPEERLKLFRTWEKMIGEKKYLIIDFWNSSTLTNGCIAYGRDDGYLYIDWNGNIMPCVFVPYYVYNINDLFSKNKKLADALLSKFFINGRKWQNNYGFSHPKNPDNWLMACSIRDHFKNFRENILTKDSKPEDKCAESLIKSKEMSKFLDDFDNKLEKLTLPIWKKEYLKEDDKNK